MCFSSWSTQEDMSPYNFWSRKWPYLDERVELGSTVFDKAFPALSYFFFLNGTMVYRINIVWIVEDLKLEIETID